MANPDISSSTSTTKLDRNLGILTTTSTTIVPEVAVGEVQNIVSIALAGVASGTFGVQINHNTTQIAESLSLTGFTTEIISGPITTLTEGDYMTGKATANSSVTYIINKRVMT